MQPITGGDGEIEGAKTSGKSGFPDNKSKNSHGWTQECTELAKPVREHVINIDGEIHVTGC